MFVVAVFRTRDIHTLHSAVGLFISAVRLFIFVRLLNSVRRSFHFCECLWSPFLQRGIFIHFIRLFIMYSYTSFGRLLFIHTLHSAVYVIFQKRVRVFHRCFKHEKTDERTRPQAECFYCFRVFETPMKHEARVFEITSPTEEN